MQTLREVKTEMYQNMKDRFNDFLSEEERYIVDNLKSDIDESWKDITYTEDEACDIVCQSLDWMYLTDTENACWEAWYIRGYEVALNELMNHFKSINMCDEAMNKDSKIFTSIKLEDMINNLLTN